MPWVPWVREIADFTLFHKNFGPDHPSKKPQSLEKLRPPCPQGAPLHGPGHVQRNTASHHSTVDANRPCSSNKSAAFQKAQRPRAAELSWSGEAQGPNPTCGDPSYSNLNLPSLCTVLGPVAPLNSYKVSLDTWRFRVWNPRWGPATEMTLGKSSVLI